MARYNAMVEDFEEVTIFEMPALFTILRIDRETVHEGYHLYEVRHDDYCRGDAVQLGTRILVNHWGSLITREEIVMEDDGLLDIDPEDINYGVGDCSSMDDFMSRYPAEVAA